MADRGERQRGAGTLRSLLVLVALALLLALFLFFVPLNQQLQFSRMLWTGAFQNKEDSGILVFPGNLKASALGFAPEELSKVRKFLQESGPGVKRVEVWASQQDAYAALRQNSELSVDVIVFMEDGTVLKPPTIPMTRKELSEKLLWRIRRDLDAYNKAAVKGGVGKDVIITNVM